MVIKMSNNIVRDPVQERSIKTKKKIIEAATKLFSDKGFHRTNTKEIASEAGVAIGSFYSYFKDKKDVFKNALEVYLYEFHDMLEKEINCLKINTKDHKQIILELIGIIIKAHDVFKAFHNEVLSNNFSDSYMEELLMNTEEKSLEKIRNYLLLFKEDLIVGDIDTATFIVYKTISTIVDTIVFTQQDIKKERIINETGDMLTRYLFES